VFSHKVAIVCAFLGGLAFLWSVRRILVLLFIAGVLAAGIAPAVRRVRVVIRLYTRRKIERGTAVLIVYLPFLIGAVLLAIFLVPQFINESRELGVQLPRLIDQKVLTPLAAYLPVTEIRKVLYQDWTSELPLFGYLRGAITVTVSIIAVLVLIAYMLVDAQRIRNTFLLLYPPEDRSKKRQMVLRASRRMTHWLSGQLILAGLIGVATFLALLALQIPYALPLALAAAVGELIPVIGPIVGAVPALIIALFLSTWQFWAVLITAVMIQQVENHFLVPRLMGRRVSVSPLAVLVAFMIGATLLGVIGAIMAIPAVALIQIFFEEAFVSRRERRFDDTRPGTLARTSRK
jgi:predicted PurR-regulated permease PerM